MDKTCKCASCMHCEMCRWVDEVEQKGCDFYAASCGAVRGNEKPLVATKTKKVSGPRRKTERGAK